MQQAENPSFIQRLLYHPAVGIVSLTRFLRGFLAQFSMFYWPAMYCVGLLLYVMRTMYMKSSQQALMFANEKGLLYSFACHEVSVKFRQKILFIELAPRAIISLLTKNTRFVAHKMGIKARGTFKFILFM